MDFELGGPSILTATHSWVSGRRVTAGPAILQPRDESLKHTPHEGGFTVHNSPRG
jgi:hypothetical protein